MLAPYIVKNTMPPDQRGIDHRLHYRLKTIFKKRNVRFQRITNCIIVLSASVLEGVNNSYFELGLGSISILYRYCDMRVDNVLEFGYRNIVIQHKCFFSWF